MAEPTDAEVIAGSVDDPASFGVIFERHHRAIMDYLARRLGRDDGYDLAAETFLRAFETRGRYHPEQANARPWLFGIATNLLQSHWRRERRRLRAYAKTGVDPTMPDAGDIEGRMDTERDVRAIAGTLSSLPGGEREVLLLYALGGSVPRRDCPDSVDPDWYQSCPTVPGAGSPERTFFAQRQRTR